MPKTTTIHVEHLTRVEGHGDIVARIRDNALAEVRFDVVEAPRFFEVFLRGQHYEDVMHVAPRICGICSVAHKTAAVMATEQAFDVDPPEQTMLLRRLAFHGEVLSSHVLHVYFLAAPDFLGVDDVFALAGSHRPEVLRAMRLKRLGYDLCAVVLGRHTHPVAMRVGGFSFVHQTRQLAQMKDRLVAARDDVQDAAKLFATFEVPQLERETEYVSLKHPTRYALCEGDLCSSLGKAVPVAQYRQTIEEYVVPHSTAKHARWNKPEYMVGALARVNNNYEQLNPLARKTAHNLGLTVPCHNPFMNTAAQIVECAHCIEDSIDIIDLLLERGIEPDAEQMGVRTQAGSGVGAVEAPRGTLFHEYQYDQEGMCTSANHVIPTAQNLANLEADMRAFVPSLIGADDEVIRHNLEMLVRAYDPCISCSTHLVRLDCA
jgi:coenzyme F420-reducing hydrogenase alpha subunit